MQFNDRRHETKCLYIRFGLKLNIKDVKYFSKFSPLKIKCAQNITLKANIESIESKNGPGLWCMNYYCKPFLKLNTNLYAEWLKCNLFFFIAPYE